MIVGLTGGIAAGKSTVRDRLASRVGIEVFDADGCVHRLLESDPGIAAEIGRLFGPRCLAPDGKPDRHALREVAFFDSESRRRLESLLHPLVRAEWQAGRERSMLEGRHYLADIPLLYETGAEGFFEAIVVVACSRETQLARLRTRGIAINTAQAMLASQLSLGQKLSGAGFVIWNDGSLAALGRQIELVAKQLFHD